MRDKDLRLTTALTIDEMEVDVTVDAVAFDQMIDSPNGLPPTWNRAIDIECFTYDRGKYTKAQNATIESYLLCNAKVKDDVMYALQELDAHIL